MINWIVYTEGNGITLSQSYCTRATSYLARSSHKHNAFSIDWLIQKSMLTVYLDLSASCQVTFVLL